jgi:hypothetical protein
MLTCAYLLLLLLLLARLINITVDADMCPSAAAVGAAAAAR